MDAQNHRFPDHLDDRGCLKIAEKHTVELPLYISEIERFWVQYRERLTLYDFQLALIGIPQARGIYHAESGSGEELYVVEFFHSWGTVFVSLAKGLQTVPQVRLLQDGVEEYKELESRAAIWKFFDQLDAVFHATK